MKYVSIRHAGLGIFFDSELDNLALYALGDSTEISHVESFASSDDGFEFFGGTVNASYLTATFNNDVQFDLDEGYSGKGQFWFSIAQEYEGDRGGEFASHDLWIRSWTALDEMKVLDDVVTISTAPAGISNQYMRMNFFVNRPGTTINSGSPLIQLKVDGINVTTAFLQKVRNDNSSPDGICYYVDFSTASSFIPAGGKPLVGPHRLDAVLPLSNGEVAASSVEWVFKK